MQEYMSTFLLRASSKSITQISVFSKLHSKVLKTYSFENLNQSTNHLCNCHTEDAAKRFKLEHKAEGQED